MKTWAKVVLCILCIVFIGWVVAWYMFFHAEKKIADYSTYCMDSVRAELSDNIWNVVLMYDGKDAWAYLYSWSVSYEGVKYNYTCAVKANIAAWLATTNVSEIANAGNTESFNFPFASRIVHDCSTGRLTTAEQAGKIYLICLSYCLI